MPLSPPSLHPPVPLSHEAEARLRLKLRESHTILSSLPSIDLTQRGTIEIPLTTVSLQGNFDAYLNIEFKGASSVSPIAVLVDSGNSVLIVPRWEDIEQLPGYTTNYEVLGAATEPWGCPAKIVRGPIQLRTTAGGIYSIENCVFYACTGESATSGQRTANFGAGCLSPWSSSGWNTPGDLNVTLQSPLSYDPTYSFAEFDYEAAVNLFADVTTPHIRAVSLLRLHKREPEGFTMLDIRRNLQWMSVNPKDLTIGNTKTDWPGTIESPIAMVDTGGGPVFLSDPNDYLYDKKWPDAVTNPTWAAGSKSCESTSHILKVALEDKKTSYAYTIDPSRLPSSARGLTLVMCKLNEYMRGQPGMNIGGISAVTNLIVVAYARQQVGFRPK